MSELTFNINGEAFEVPARATGRRVRRMRANGSPEVVYGRDGMPLVLPIDPVLLRAADGGCLLASVLDWREAVPIATDDTTSEPETSAADLSIPDAVAKLRAIVNRKVGAA